MIPTSQEQELTTPEQRRDAAKPFITALQKHVPTGYALLEIDPNTLDLLDFRMDCLARLEALQANPDAIEEREEVVSQLDAADHEIRRLCGSDVAKVDNFANLWRALEMAELHMKDRRDHYSRKAKRIAGIVEWLETIAMEALVLAGTTRFDSPNSTLRIQRNPPKVHFTDPNAVPDRFRKVTLELPADRWKQLREAQPELVQWVTEKDRTFKTADIAKVLKAAINREAELKAAGAVQGLDMTLELKKIERVKGAELRSEKRLVVE